MPEYINPPITTDSDAIAQEAIAFIREQYGDWEPRDSQLAVIVITALSLRAAQINDLVSMVPRAIFRYYGAKVVQLPPFDAQAAIASITINVRDAAGYTFEPPLAISYIGDDGDTIIFETTDTVVVPAGSTSVSGVIFTAQDEGADANGLTEQPELAEGSDAILSVSMQGSTSAGADAEEDDAYLTRLSTRLGLSAPRPIFARDFATFLRTEFPEVYRAVAIDNYIPGSPPTTDAERAVTISPIAEDGSALTPNHPVYKAYLEANREWNFLVNVVAPTYTTIDVQFQITVHGNFQPASALASAQAAVADYLSAARWGIPDSGDSLGWERRTAVEAYELATVINNTEGVSRVIPGSLLFRKAGGAFASTTIELDGDVPLPQAGTITGTVV